MLKKILILLYFLTIEMKLMLLYNKNDFLFRRDGMMAILSSGRSRFFNEHPIIYVILGIIVLGIGISFINGSNAERADEERFFSVAEEIEAQCTDIKTRDYYSRRRHTVHYDGYFSYEYNGTIYTDRLISDVGSDIELYEWYYIYVDPSNPADCRLPYTEQYKSSQNFGSWAITIVGGVCILLGIVFMVLKSKRPKASLNASSGSSSSYGNVFDTYSSPSENMTNNTFSGTSANTYNGYNQPSNNFGMDSMNNTYNGYNQPSNNFGTDSMNNTYNGYNQSSNNFGTDSMNNTYNGYNQPSNNFGTDSMNNTYNGYNQNGGN